MAAASYPRRGAEHCRRPGPAGGAVEPGRTGGKGPEEKIGEGEETNEKQRE